MKILDVSATTSKFGV